MHDCLIAFGSNEGDSVVAFEQTLVRLEQCVGISVLASSQPIQTEPVGGPQGQDRYLNAAIRVETSLSPVEFHEALVAIETDLGRERRERWGSRKVDLDLLIYSEVVLETESLTIPHPRMSFRRFVLEPASEIAGEMIHVSSGLAIDRLLEILNEREKVVLLVGSPESSTRLRRSLSDEQLAGWKLSLVSEVELFHQTKESARLVCTIGSDDKANASSVELIGLAKSFAGPTLRLPNDVEKSKTEIMAALAAMS